MWQSKVLLRRVSGSDGMSILEAQPKQLFPISWPLFFGVRRHCCAAVYGGSYLSKLRKVALLEQGGFPATWNSMSRAASSRMKVHHGLDSLCLTSIAVDQMLNGRFFKETRTHQFHIFFFLYFSKCRGKFKNYAILILISNEIQRRSTIKSILCLEYPLGHTNSWLFFPSSSDKCAGIYQ